MTNVSTTMAPCARIGERKPSPAEFDAAMSLFQLPRAGSASPPATNARGSGSATPSPSQSPLMPRHLHSASSSPSSSAGRRQILQRNNLASEQSVSSSVRTTPRSYSDIRNGNSGSRDSSLARSLSPPAVPRNAFHTTMSAAPNQSLPQHFAPPFGGNDNPIVKKEIKPPPSPNTLANAHLLESLIGRSNFEQLPSPLTVPSLSLPTSANALPHHGSNSNSSRTGARSASDADIRPLSAGFLRQPAAAHMSRSSTSSPSSAMKFEPSLFSTNVISPPPVDTDLGGLMPMADSPTATSGSGPPTPAFSVSVSAPPSTTNVLSTYLAATENFKKNLMAVPWNSSKKRNSACHFCDHAAQRPGRNKVALQVACCMRDCRKVFCSRPACFKKLPIELGVATYPDFVKFRERVEAGVEIFVCPHCADESTCHGPQCYRRWEKRRKNVAQANNGSSSSTSSGGFMNNGLKSLRTLGGRFKGSKSRSGSMGLPPSSSSSGAADKKRKGSSKSARDMMMNIFSRNGAVSASTAAAGDQTSSHGDSGTSTGNGSGSGSKHLKRQRSSKSLASESESSRRMSAQEEAALATYGGSVSSAEAQRHQRRGGGQRAQASSSSSLPFTIESISAGAATPPAPFNRSGSGNARLAKRRCTDNDVNPPPPSIVAPPFMAPSSTSSRNHLHPFGTDELQPSLGSLRKSVSLPTHGSHPLAADAFPSLNQQHPLHREPHPFDDFGSGSGRDGDIGEHDRATDFLHVPITRQSRSLPSNFSHPMSSTSGDQQQDRQREVVVKTEPSARSSFASPTHGATPPPLERPQVTSVAQAQSSACQSSTSSRPQTTPTIPQPVYVPMNMMQLAIPVSGAGAPAGYIAVVPASAAAAAAAASGSGEPAAANPFAAFVQHAAAAASTANSSDSSAAPAPATGFPMFVPVVQAPAPDTAGASSSGATAASTSAFPGLFPIMNMQQLMQMQVQLQQHAAAAAAPKQPHDDGDIDMQDLSKALPSTAPPPTATSS